MWVGLMMPVPASCSCVSDSIVVYPCITHRGMSVYPSHDVSEMICQPLASASTVAWWTASS